MQRSNLHITGLSPAQGERLRLGLLLKLLAVLVFPAAAILAAVLERSWLLVAVLAVGMMIVGQIERFRIAHAAGVDMRLQLHILFAGFAWRVGVLSGLFIVMLGILALFRDTALAREIGIVDVVVALAATGIAMLANLIGGRMAGEGLAASFSAFRSSFSQSAETDYAFDGEIIEGEVIDPANDNKS